MNELANNQSSDLQIRRDIELGEDLEYLKNLPQFQRVILEGYITQVLMKDSQYMISMDPASRQKTMEEIMSVGYFREYLGGITNAADVARSMLAEGE